MYAIHQTILPPSAIHHSLFLPNFTPSTIYPLPQPHSVDAPQVSVVGNLIVAGSNDLRVFEIRESQIPVLGSTSKQNGVNGNADGSDEEGEIEEGMEEDFYDTGHVEVCIALQNIGVLAHDCRYQKLTMSGCSIEVQDGLEATPPGLPSATWYRHWPCCSTDDRVQRGWIRQVAGLLQRCKGVLSLLPRPARASCHCCFD